METQNQEHIKPYTIKWWFAIYNIYSRQAFEHSREYMKTSDKKSLEKYSKCYTMVNWIQSRLCEKYGQYDFNKR